MSGLTDLQAHPKLSDTLIMFAVSHRLLHFAFALPIPSADHYRRIKVREKTRPPAARHTSPWRDQERHSLHHFNRRPPGSASRRRHRHDVIPPRVTWLDVVKMVSADRRPTNKLRYVWVVPHRHSVARCVWSIGREVPSPQYANTDENLQCWHTQQLIPKYIHLFTKKVTSCRCP